MIAETLVEQEEHGWLALTSYSKCLVPRKSSSNCAQKNDGWITNWNVNIDLWLKRKRFIEKSLKIVPKKTNERWRTYLYSIRLESDSGWRAIVISPIESSGRSYVIKALNPRTRNSDILISNSRTMIVLSKNLV